MVIAPYLVITGGRVERDGRARTEARTAGLRAWPESFREKIGDRVGSYELCELLGEGAMSRVYRARHVELGRSVALKILRLEYAGHQDTLERLRAEARLVNRISHPHIVQVLDIIEQPLPMNVNRLCLVMELLPGRPLDALIATRGLSVKRAVRIARQLCLALAAAHRIAVVHRDVKPENVFVSSAPDGDFVKLLDFGLAKLLCPLEGLSLRRTVDGVVMGTPGYMAPEQVRGEAARPTHDIYSLGVVLYELLTGQLPFESHSFADQLSDVLHTAPRDLPSATPTGEPIPKGLRDVVLRCLEKGAEDRFRSMVGLHRALEAYAEEAPSPLPEPRRLRHGWKARLPWMILGLLATGAAVHGEGGPSARSPSNRGMLGSAEQPLPIEPLRATASPLPAAQGSAASHTPAPPPTAALGGKGPSRTNTAARARPSQRVSFDGVIDPFAD